MRTNIVIDDGLMRDALKISGLKTKRETVEKGLALLIKFAGQSRVKSFKGKLKWEGDLEQMRRD